MENTCEPFSETFLPLQSQLKAQTELWEKWDFLIGGFEWHTKKTGNTTCILENASKTEEGWSNQVTCSMGELDCNTPNIRAGLKYPKKGKWGVCNTRFPLKKKTDNIVIACSNLQCLGTPACASFCQSVLEEQTNTLREESNFYGEDLAKSWGSIPWVNFDAKNCQITISGGIM